MGEGFQFIDIILFAMIAAFLILRLRSVLGRRQDQGQDHRSSHDPFSRQKGDDNIVQLPDQGDRLRPADPFEPEAEEVAVDPSASPLDAGFTQIKIAMPEFDRSEFMNGARMAFEMIIQAFADGDTETLKSLLNNEVYQNFVQAIRAREDAKETLENTLVRIRSAEPIEAYMEGSAAYVTVKLVSEQVNVTRNEDGEVVDGDPNHIAEITDIWTFSRDTTSPDPNWELVATRSLD